MKLSHVLMRSAKQPPPDFLELVAETQGDVNNSFANFYISLPATEPNDLVVVSLYFSGNVGPPTINSSGWAQTGLTLGVVVRGELLMKVVNGSESAISLTSAHRISKIWVVRVYRSKTGRTPKISATSQGQTGNAPWNLPAITPDGGVHGTQKFTFIAAFASYGSITSVPAAYSNFTQHVKGCASIAHHEAEADHAEAAGPFGPAPSTRIQFAIWEE